MELISLLLQQEMDMQKQQAASEQQGAQLEKCEAELKKVKAQVRDLEDYIDNLLLRIMEQTPTLLQVRNRHKWQVCWEKFCTKKKLLSRKKEIVSSKEAVKHRVKFPDTF